jgi:glycosyltransferase involved in cell wall biosynthesis
MQQPLQLRQSKDFLTLGTADDKEVDAQHCSNSGSRPDRGSTRHPFDKRCSAGGGSLSMPMIDDLSETDSPVEQKQIEQSSNRPSYPLRVAYDAQAFLSPNKGLGKGVQLRSLLGPYLDTFAGFATRGRNYSEQRLIQRGLPRYQLWHQLSLPYQLQQWRADVFLAPYNTAPLFIPKRTKLILVLHDLILLERFKVPNLRKRMNNEFRRFLIPRAVSRAHTVLTVSSYSKQQIVHHFPSADVQVIPCTVGPSWFAGKHVRTFAERENCILAVTGDVPHKNPHRALEGYAAFVAQSDRSTVPHLRVVGMSGSIQKFRRWAEMLNISDLVHIEPYLTEDQLQDLYRRSRAVLFPSLMEGFGIPVLEAMASGTPVITSNTTSLPEVGGPAANYFDPTDVAGMATALKQVLDYPDRQQKMIELGFAQANKFHPDSVRLQIQAFWDALAAAPSPR